ncbi:NAD-dependent epimerase/dehydratase family protein [Amycolatopsis sp. lyj-108]|uniref:NAD-dependent epimerase/dehydratase family protein n=1 Tax=Amycolatopsis sp. lyj-108 TaxID=2789286 RepID=UPI00397D30B6
MGAERVMITGGAGFVGLHLARHLVSGGSEVTLVDDFSRGRQDENFRELGEHVALFEHDLREPLPFDPPDDGFDAVYHLAAVVGVARVSQNAALVLDVNLRSALNVLEWCHRYPPGALFLSSTSEVADGAAGLGLTAYPTKEDGPFALAAPAAPRASYALSKVVAESLFRQSGLSRVRIGRYHNIYGPRMGDEHVIPQFVARALGRLDPFPVYGGTQARAFCYIEDAIDATVALTRLPDADPMVVNIGNDREEIRIDRLADKVVTLAGYRPALDIHPAPAGSPERRLPDLGRLRDAVGYRPRVSLDEGLRRTFEWYLAERTRTEP